MIRFGLLHHGENRTQKATRTTILSCIQDKVYRTS
jgi:hypothetical protein